jgi:hypothetical protein
MLSFNEDMVFLLYGTCGGFGCVLVLLWLYLMNHPSPKNKQYQSAYLGDKANQNIWTKEKIDDQTTNVKSQIFTNDPIRYTYHPDVGNEIFNFLAQMDLTGKSVLVIGSERPWLEVIALASGAANVTTLEYGAIISQHPQIKTMTPDIFRQSYLDNSLSFFDAVLSFSSLEHSGLGRYGDALNPWGDILSLARAHCVTKDDGQLMLGLPSGEDTIEWNLHQQYGDIRWPLVTINWIPIDEVADFDKGRPNCGGQQHLFRKVPSRSSSNTNNINTNK